MKASREEVAANLSKLRKLLERPNGVTAAAAVERFGINRRTFYRWLDELGAQGCAVERRGLSRPTVYRIEAPSSEARAPR